MRLLELFEDATQVQVNGLNVGWLMIVLGVAMLVATFVILSAA